MTWAEFRIRSFAFRRQREWDMMMTREIAYEVFTLKFMFGKQKPPTKKRYWPIGEEGSNGGMITPEMIEEFQKEWSEYELKIKQDVEPTI